MWLTSMPEQILDFWQAKSGKPAPLIMNIIASLQYDSYNQKGRDDRKHERGLGCGG